LPLFVSFVAFCFVSRLVRGLLQSDAPVDEPVSIALETTCRRGGVALGRGDALLDVLAFDASARQATQLVPRLDELLARAHLRPADVREVYVSVGPGSFTGTRLGVTVARTLAQAVPGVRCVGVPAPQAVAWAARDLAWDNLGVVLDARQGLIYAQLYARDGRDAVPAGPGRVLPPAEFLAAAPRPLALLGEGLAHHDLRAEGVDIPPRDDDDLHLPRPDAVWRLGRQRARAGAFTPPERLLPIYTRLPQAQRLWEQRRDATG
jgi:tRNA threonylcarbamoyladenosine biosynthesis protein TsaB